MNNNDDQFQRVIINHDVLRDVALEPRTTSNEDQRTRCTLATFCCFPFKEAHRRDCDQHTRMEGELRRPSFNMFVRSMSSNRDRDRQSAVRLRKRWSFNFSKKANNLRFGEQLKRRRSNRNVQNEKNKNKNLPILRKRKITVPVHLFDNPYFTQTTVSVDARYEHLKHVGGGRFGVVVSAVDSFTNDRVAIKKVFSAFDSVHSARHILREVRLLRYLQHPHVVGLLDIDVPSEYESWDSVCIVTPLLKMDLRTALVSGKLEDRQTQKRIIAQLLVALAHMHRKRVMHRDVKSLNVLLDADFNAQFCDLGEARFYSGTTGRPHDDNLDTLMKETELTVGPRTALQSAPEMFLNEQYDAAVDLWGIGCITAEMLHPTHRYLFDDMNTRTPIKTIVQVLGFPTESQIDHLEKASSRWYMSLAKRNSGPGTLRSLLKNVDDLALDFVESLLRFSPKERMNAEQALRHPFLADVVSDVLDQLVLSSDSESSMFDFRLTEPPERMSIKSLKELVWDEVISFHPEAEIFR